MTTSGLVSCSAIITTSVSCCGRCSSGAGKAVDEELKPGVQLGNNPLVDAEKAALEKIGQNSQSSSNLGAKPLGTVLQQQAEKKLVILLLSLIIPAYIQKTSN